jgi:carbamoyl-phosphate synthase small subunit
MGTETGIRRLASRPAVLVLADGTVFRGAAFGAKCVRTGEVCFNTSMTGYQEILTDPSYAGQMVVMTYTQIGNVGVNPTDDESGQPWLSAFIVRELFEEPSNWRSQASLDTWLAERGIPGLSDIDTRALVRRIRDHGFQNAALSTDPEQQDVDALLAAAREAPDLSEVDLVGTVTCEAPYEWSEGTWPGVVGQVPSATTPEQRLKVVAFDFGVKRNILRLLADHGFDVTVVPATTSAAAVDALGPDAVFLSNGPGDPAAVTGVPETVRELVDRYPTFGICLGHQILGRALGGTTAKLKFGHHGGNQPGKDLHSGQVAICAENHGYAVDAESLRAAGEPVEVTHVNLNDQTVEGIAHLERPVFSVQYHPEASPGPHDASYFFTRFRRMVELHKAGEPVTGASVAQEG